MAQRKLKLSFNSAITGIDPATGAYNEATHKEQILPLRGLVMQLDGVTGMFIAQYGMEVDYLDEIVSADAVFETVQSAIGQLVGAEGSSLFPLRDAKVPAVTIDRHAPQQPDHRKTLIISFGTDLTAYTNDDAYWGRAKAHVGEHLANKDGVRGYGIFLREVCVAFDTRTTTETAMRRHARSVLQNLPQVEDGSWNGEGERPLDFFPFLGEHKLTLRYKVVDGVRVN